jgi:hypothetical protein
LSCELLTTYPHHDDTNDDAEEEREKRDAPFAARLPIHLVNSLVQDGRHEPFAHLFCHRSHVPSAPARDPSSLAEVLQPSGIRWAPEATIAAKKPAQPENAGLMMHVQDRSVGPLDRERDRLP